MAGVDDITLVQMFVRGEQTLMSNANFRMVPVCDVVQLSDKTGSLIAIARVVGQKRIISVRQSSTHLDLISCVLVEHRYIPVNATGNGFIEYAFRPLPSGYEAAYTETRQLWRMWQSYSRLLRAAKTARPKLMVMTENGWEPIRSIGFCDENFFIQASTEELLLHRSDRLVWLNAIEESEQATSATLESATLQ